MKNVRLIVALTVLLAGAAGVAAAEDRPWELSLGLSYLATSGNSESQTGGLDLSYKHRFAPWGLEAAGSFLKAEADGAETANRTFFGVRGTRTFAEGWSFFSGASALRDEFAGLASRYVVDAGVTYTAIATETRHLALDLGVAWNSENLVGGGGNDYMSGVAGLAYGWKLSENAKLSERLAFVPSFEESDDWRVSSETALEAAVSAKLAVKLGFVYLYDNVPVAGFRKTDTKSSASLVIKL